MVEQSEELTALVGDLIELARGDQPGPETDDVRLDGVAAESLARARRNAPGIHFDATLVPTVIDGVPERLARAINNLLDNAARHSPPGGTVELQVGPSGVEVRDHGTGVDPEDLPYVFDRFFRGTQLPRPPGQRAGPVHRAPGGRAARRQRLGDQRRRRRRDLHAAPARRARRERRSRVARRRPTSAAPGEPVETR